MSLNHIKAIKKSSYKLGKLKIIYCNKERIYIGLFQAKDIILNQFAK
jgi:hypothetical protein